MPYSHKPNMILLLKDLKFMGEYLGMRKNSSKVKFLIVLVLSFIFSLPCLADENIISSVIISKSKVNPEKYELNIDSSQTVRYKTRIERDNSIYFDLKNSILADNSGTIYDDVNDIDNVIVKQLDKNKVRIYVEGKNARNTELIFTNSTPKEINKTLEKQVIINRPIDQYQPTNNTDLDNEDIQDWNDNSFNFSHLGTAIFQNLKEGSLGIILIILSVIALFAILIKSLATKLSQDSEPLIGLNAQKQFSNNNELNDITQRSQTLKMAQMELTKAHQKYQDYLQNKYKDSYKEKLKSVNTDMIKKGIALNQYQKSTQNPYKNQEVLKMNKDFTQTPYKVNNDSFRLPPKPKAINNNFNSPYIQRPSNKINYAQKNTIKKDNMKFLESVTKIYEQSGRSDLANELKNSISKAKQSI